MSVDKKEKVAKGKAIGGVARSKKLSAERRSEIARDAAIARHEKNKIPVSIKKGNFIEEFGFDVDCYVLNNRDKTAVITRRSFGNALDLGEGGTRLMRFVNYQYMQDYISPELKNKLENPIVFQINAEKEEGVAAKGYGYDVTILIDLCNAIIDAYNAEKKVPDRVRDQAMIIVSASAKSGIQELVYKLVGFDSTKEQFIDAFKKFVSEEAKKYEKEFPVELYLQWARLYKLTIPAKGWPWKFKTLTEDHIYYPLVASKGNVLTLLRDNKEKEGDKRKKLFQFLNEVGTRALRMHLGRVLEMAESSKTVIEYEEKVRQRFGNQLSLFETELPEDE